MTPAEAAKAAAREYGEAIRGDWSDIDGRSVRNNMWDLMLVIDGDMTLPSFRAAAGICPAGRGHWTEYCTEQCERAEETK